MHLLMATAVGLLFAAGLYMMLRRSFVKLVIGLLLIGHASNLLIFTSGGLLVGKPPLIEKDAQMLPGAPGEGYTDPLPPALILTAIVISFAIVSYTIVLIKRVYQEVGTDDLDEMVATDRPWVPEPKPASADDVTPAELDGPDEGELNAAHAGGHS